MPDRASIKAGEELPTRTFVASNVSLFLYNAAIWNAHRIHYDEPYATQVEAHDGVVIDGPLQGDWLTQVVLGWLGDDGELLEFEYSNRQASMVGDPLTAGGVVTAIENDEVELTLFLRNSAGENVTPGSAKVRLK